MTPIISERIERSEPSKQNDHTQDEIKEEEDKAEEYGNRLAAPEELPDIAKDTEHGARWRMVNDLLLVVS